jgi:hypothetical protein
MAKPERQLLPWTEKGGAWRAEVSARMGELEDRVKAVPVDPKRPYRETVRATVDDELNRAFTAMTRDRSTIRAWWSGASITKAWEAIHNAELALLQIESKRATLATAPRLLAWVEKAMDEGDPKKAHVAVLKAEAEKKEGDSPDRLKIRAVLMDVIAANRQRYEAVRVFRNNLILVTFALAICLLGLATWHSVNHHILQLCTEKKGVAAECLNGKEPSSSDVWLVLAMGVLGGLLGIAFRLSNNDEASRFDPKAWQRLLKPVTGAATGLVAVLILVSGIVAQPVTHPTRADFLVYAVIFGFSQQLLTKFVDARAESLITPSKK